ncbi:MAG TPA: MFS transporter [Actinocrinis sp.]|jgi:predicted MFS family arabinose efflux permease
MSTTETDTSAQNADGVTRAGANADVGKTAQPRAPRKIVWLLAVACGVTAANFYYCQSLLPRIAQSFHATQSATGALVTSIQLGYAAGLFLLVPLGDITRRRRLVCILLLIETAAMAISAAAPTLAVLIAAGALVGIAGCVVQILVPYAASIAADHERGHVVGTVFTGLLGGILISRTVAGLAGQLFGRRAVFGGAAVLVLVLSGVLFRAMQDAEPEMRLSYGRQLRASFELIATVPVLRRRSLIGACVFGAFGLFWATIAFLLAGPPFHQNQAEIGLFALVGAAGASAAPRAGRLGDRGRQRPASAAFLVLGALSFAAIAAGRTQLLWLIVGVLVMDAAVQSVHILNLSVIYELAGAARARINSVYMTSYFLGGALGSAVGTQAYRLGGWTAVSSVGAGFLVLGLLVWTWDAVAARRRPARGDATA